jgi:hypothetical protein
LKLIKIFLPSTHNFIPFSDTHGGSRMSHVDGIQSLIETILSDRQTYCGHGGDMGEAISIDDKRFDMTSREPIPLQQAKNNTKLYRPLAQEDRLKYILLGNHELKLWKFGNLSKYVADELGVEYGTYSSIIEVHDNYGLMYRMYVSHGFGVLTSNAKDPEQRKANMAAALKQKLKNKAGDCLIMCMGHTHKLIIVPPSEELIIEHSSGRPKQKYITQGDATASFIEPNRRWYVNTGSFYKLYTDEIEVSGYGEIKGYDPTELGYPVIEVRDRKVVNIRRVVV